jgi:protoheme IX farnesyltransferase
VRRAYSLGGFRWIWLYLVADCLSNFGRRAATERALSSTISRVDGVAAPIALTGWRATVNDYYELTKPRIIYLLLTTTFAAMMMAQRGLPPFWLTVFTLAGGALASASAGAFNCVWDRDIDRLMRRTKTRPLAARRVSVPHALVFGVITGCLSFGVFLFCVNPLAAWLALAGNVFYVLIYTIWLKRRTPLNIVIGGAAGAVPPLVGWAAVTGSIGWPAVALFALVFLWTPPHFWALSLMTNIDYDKAGIPMLPNVVGIARTKQEIFAYSAAMVLMSLALFPLHVLGPCYFGAAGALGLIFLFHARQLFGDPGKRWPRALFQYSLLYLALMCVAMVADRIITVIS